MVKQGNTADKKSEICQAHCPHCGKTWFTATAVENLIFKCFKCHRRYLVDIFEGGVSIKPLSLSEEEQKAQQDPKRQLQEDKEG